MVHLWSPWRMSYIQDQQPKRRCLFCHVLKMEDGVENLIVKRGVQAFAILNRYPYTSGHVMVVPYCHASTLDELDESICNDMMRLVRQAITAIGTVYQPDGFNVGANLGAAAGAGIAQHVHFHVVPRWGGDTNFMTSVGHARVLPEDLCETYQRLRDAWPVDPQDV